MSQTLGRKSSWHHMEGESSVEDEPMTGGSQESPVTWTLPCSHMALLCPRTLRTPFLLLSKPELGEHWPSRWAPRWRSLSWAQAWAAPRPHLPPQSLRCCCRPRWVPTLHCPASCTLTPPHSRPYHQGSLPKSRMHICFGKPSLLTSVLETAS